MGTIHPSYGFKNYTYLLFDIINIAKFSLTTNREVCMRAWIVCLAVFLFASFTYAQEKTEAKEITLKVSGMTCGVCEEKVEKAASAIEGVGSAKASHQSGEVIILLTGDVSLERLEGAIDETGFKVVKKEGKEKEKKKRDGGKESDMK
jgi:copper chaperone CopZ